MKWVNSTSKDVVGHSIYRTENPNNIEWTQVYTCTNLSQTTWVDENVKPMTTYYYKIHAFDEVQLQSIAGNKIKVITNSIKVDVSNLEIQAKLMDKQVHLTWTNLPNVRKYIVYKKAQVESTLLFQVQLPIILLIKTMTKTPPMFCGV